MGLHPDAGTAHANTGVGEVVFESKRTSAEADSEILYNSNSGEMYQPGMLPKIDRRRRFERDSFGPATTRARPKFPRLTPRAATMNQNDKGIPVPDGNAWGGSDGRKLVGKLQSSCDQEQSHFVTREAKEMLRREEALANALDCAEYRQASLSHSKIVTAARDEARKSHAHALKLSRIAEKHALMWQKREEQDTERDIFK